jgi:hypothetical protein
MKREKEKRSKIAGGDLVVGSLGPVTGTSIIRSRGGPEPCRDIRQLTLVVSKFSVLAFKLI